MKHTEPAPRTRISDPALDALLASAARVDLDPLSNRALRVSLEKCLAAGGAPSSFAKRLEPSLLVAVSALHLLWAVVRILELR